MEDMVIKREDAINVKDLLYLLGEFAKEYISADSSQHVKDQYASYIKSNSNLISLILYKKEEPIGCIQLFHYKHPPMLAMDEYIEGEILNFYVLSTERNKEYGQKLLDAIIDEARSNRIGYLRLNSTPSAESIYRRYGFKNPVFNFLSLKI